MSISKLERQKYHIIRRWIFLDSWDMLLAKHIWIWYGEKIWTWIPQYGRWAISFWTFTFSLQPSTITLNASRNFFFFRYSLCLHCFPSSTCHSSYLIWKAWHLARTKTTCISLKARIPIPMYLQKTTSYKLTKWHPMSELNFKCVKTCLKFLYDGLSQTFISD